MKMLRRVAAIAAVGLPFSPSALAQAPAAAPAIQNAEYPMTCSAAAKPLTVKALEAAITGHAEDSRGLFKQAIQADPKCATAKAWFSVLKPPSEANALFSEAMGMISGLSEVEKLDLQAIEARRNGDGEKALSIEQKASALLPSCAVVQLRVYEFAQQIRRNDLMLDSATKAAQLDPSNGAAWNAVGYANVALKRYPDAIAAFKKYGEVAPTDPNAYDDLGDALLANNQLDEAAVQYQKSIDVSSGKFFASWTGIAAVKAIKGDWAGVQAALAKAQQGAVAEEDKIDMGGWTAWAWCAQGKMAEADKALARYEADSKKINFQMSVAWVPAVRGAFAFQAGKYADASREWREAADQKLDFATESQRLDLVGDSVAGVLHAQAVGGKVADAEKTMAELEALYAKAPDSEAKVGHLAESRGLIALAKGDTKAAVGELSKCPDESDSCRLDLALAQEKAGDAAAAAQTRDHVMKANRRDPTYWPTRVRCEREAKAAGKAKGKKVADRAEK